MVAPLKLKREEIFSKAKSYEFSEISPIAKVLVNTPVTHLEAIYDYFVPKEISQKALVGSIVKVEFGKQFTQGVIVDRIDQSDEVNIKPILGVLGIPGMVNKKVIAHISATRDRFGGGFWDVLNSHLPSIPLRELNLNSIERDGKRSNLKVDLTKFLEKSAAEIICNQEIIRCAIHDPSGAKPYELLVEIIKARANIGQVLIICSDFREFDYVANLLSQVITLNFVKIDTRNNKTDRYTNFVLANTSGASVILANRSGVFTNLEEKSTVIVINDFDQSHYEKRKPGWNSRDVSLLRSHDTTLIFYSAVASLEVQRLINTGWIKEIPISNLIKHTFSVLDGRDSDLAVIRKSLKNGNVLISVADKGYANVFLCAKCRNLALCDCGGKLQIKEKAAAPVCKLCDSQSKNWKCKYCLADRPYVIAKGMDRTAEEIGKAFPGVEVLISNSEHVVQLREGEVKIVISTRGAEPVSNYAGLILLDGEKMYNQPYLRAEELTRQNWFGLISRVVADGDIYLSLLNNHPLVQDVIRNERKSQELLNQREAAKLTPFYRVCVISGETMAVNEFANNLQKLATFLIVGPSEVSKNQSKLIIKTTLETSSNLVELIDEVTRLQSIKGRDIFDFRFDPYDL
ncbi:MAG: hypothetical protein F2589_04590 [Actinobacteria bacterium]|uniref:Unannotated protein n=1 Tax=freshwater metagenome TaxID=449393 RepID=A0A6J6HQK7_9ZZZZ|nr:hypothetical protein [Actinomycetota bacterium]